MSMTSTTSAEDLARRWQERVQVGTFSPVILGLGTIRVMGTSGDTPVAFPRISSLGALAELEPDEQWALRTAEAIVTHARARNRPVLAVQAPTAGNMPQAPVPLTAFDPQATTLLVMSMITGG